MNTPHPPPAPSLTKVIMEDLYNEALYLADDVRALFSAGLNRPGEPKEARPSESAARMAASHEGLKTTTRMMHALAWLLHQRALLSGELTRAQLRKDAGLPPDRPADPALLELLDQKHRALILETCEFYARLARIDAAWRTSNPAPSPVNLLQDRVRRELGAA